MKYLSFWRLYAVSVLSLLFSFYQASPMRAHAAGSATAVEFGSHTIPDAFSTQRPDHPLFSSDTYTITLGRGEQYQLPTGSGTVLSPVYSSNKKQIATVDANGMITARKSGRTTIFIHTRQLSAVYHIRVCKPSLALSRPSIDLFHCR